MSKWSRIILKVDIPLNKETKRIIFWQIKILFKLISSKIKVYSKIIHYFLNNLIFNICSILHFWTNNEGLVDT